MIGFVDQAKQEEQLLHSLQEIASNTRPGHPTVESYLSAEDLLLYMEEQCSD